MIKKCPKCGSEKIAPILYGMPAFDEEMERELNDQKLYLGGCCITGSDPEYHCFGCGKGIASPPILHSKYGEEDYRDIVTSIRFSDGGFFNGYSEVFIKRTSEKIELVVKPPFSDIAVVSEREMTVGEWKKLINRLYSKLYLHEWKKRFNDWTILDGEQWDLEISLTHGRKRTYSGSNAYPPYWDELKSTFRPFFKEAGINY